MPSQYQWSVDRAAQEARSAFDLGIPAVVAFSEADRDTLAVKLAAHRAVHKYSAAAGATG